MKSSSNLLFVTVMVVALIMSGCSSLAGKLPGQAALPGNGKTVRMGQATWDTGWFQARVFKLLLEELGYTVEEPVSLDNVAFYVFAAQGNIHFWANGWFPIHNRYLDLEKVGDRVEMVGFQVEAGGVMGYLVDKSTAEEFGITNMRDLQDPAIASVFDSDGDGKADLIGCNAGWACARVIEHHLDAYQLRDTVTHVQGNYSAMMEETITRHEQGQPILFLTWTPNWTVSELVIGEDVMWLGVPFSSLPDNADADTEAESVSGCLETPCDLGFDLNDIRIVANRQFLEANPAARKLFELVEIPLLDISDQNALMATGENAEKDIERHAAMWIEDNRQLVDQWLQAAREAAP